MIRVKTFTVQLIDAKPDRIRICRIDGESRVSVGVPREDLAEAKSLPEMALNANGKLFGPKISTGLPSGARCARNPACVSITGSVHA